MDDAELIRRRKRRSNGGVLSGVLVLALSLWVSAHELLPPVVTTVTALIGMALIMYGVHVGWLVFYEREPEGPAS